MRARRRVCYQPEPVRTLRVLLVVLAFSSCGGGLERVTYVTDALTYAPGGRLELALGNVSAFDVKVNLCLSQLRKEDGSAAGISNVETCELEQLPLKPGERLTERKTLPPETAPGRYRYEATITLPNGSGETVLTPVFTVE